MTTAPKHKPLSGLQQKILARHKEVKGVPFGWTWRWLLDGNTVSPSVRILIERQLVKPFYFTDSASLVRTDYAEPGKAL